MYTYDDALFCLLHSCKEDIDVKRLVYYMYLYQVAGFNYKFKYSLGASGFQSKGLDGYLSSIICESKVVVDNGILKHTSMGTLYYDGIVMTAEEWEVAEYIKGLLDNLDTQELFLVCLADTLVSDVREKYGAKGLIQERDRIRNTLKTLSPCYTEENFNSALKIVRLIKEKAL